MISDLESRIRRLDGGARRRGRRVGGVGHRLAGVLRAFSGRVGDSLAGGQPTVTM